MHSRSSRRATIIHRRRDRRSSAPSPTSGSPTGSPPGERMRTGALPDIASGTWDSVKLLAEDAERIGEGHLARLGARMVPSAYLRVFRSLDRFERDEQLHWERYLVQRTLPSGRPRYADRATGAGLGLLAPSG